MANNKETWKDIPDYDGKYQVSNLGNIKSFNRKTPNILKPSGNRYLHVVLTKNGKLKTYSVHRLVAITFIENPYKKQFVNHIDGNIKNNRVDNLEWVTNQENAKHAWKIGLNENCRKAASNHQKNKKSENNSNVKLTKEQVNEIRFLYSNGNTTHSKLAKIFNVSKSTIGFIVTYRSWNRE